MTYYLMFFVTGFAGSFHCIGMCGGFACALGRDPRGPAATGLRHLLYNTGRLTSYVFLGALAAALIRRYWRRAEPYTVPVASGVIAGESLVAIAITIASTALS